MNTTQCKACGADVFFAPHIVSGKLMIFDAEPNPDASWIMEQGHMKWSNEPGDDQTRFMPHHATCPSWNKVKK